MKKRCIERKYLKCVRAIKKYHDFLMEQLQDEEFKREYENLKPELDEI